MSLADSRKLIYDIASQREAEAYEQGLLKDPDMRADMERSEAASKWEGLSQEEGIIEPEAEPETEMER